MFYSSAPARSARATTKITKDAKNSAKLFVPFVSFVVKYERSLDPRLRGDEVLGGQSAISNAASTRAIQSRTAG